MYRYILFDLDGTITDPAVGITNSVRHALTKFNIHVSDNRELYKFIGPPLADSFENYYGFSTEKARLAVEYYREYYRDHGMYEAHVYPGTEELLKKLKDKGKILIVATSKPEVFAKQILQHFDIAQYFLFIAGSNLDGTRVKKAEIIHYALKECGINDLSKVIMIGDRKYDIIGAKQTGIDSVGVTQGYGGAHELESAGADYIVHTVEEILTRVLQ